MKIRITPGAVLLLLTLAPHRDLLFLATLTAAAVHECGHLLAANVLKIPIRMLEIDLMGAKIHPAAALPSYRAELLLAGAGPLFSLLLALPALLIGHAFGAALLSATLSFALFNLLPIRGFDGGRILGSALAALLGTEKADRILFLSTYLSLLLLFSLSACLLLRFGEDASLAVLSASLFAQLFLSLNTGNKK
ncbi:MAG: hypothetical protein IKM08_05355 [Clostridia bacterium]|nr:hypothetical protein [Clostridia bacterium]